MEPSTSAAENPVRENDAAHHPTTQSFSRIPSSNPRPARELKVEDALLYLDQVKMEFSDKPHIYNEFLDIMKNFKAQSINTPGVIERVKTLFKGYNKLILGFNTFLPEGEGYKIELTPEEQADQPPVSSSASVVAAAATHPEGGAVKTSTTPVPLTSPATQTSEPVVAKPAPFPAQANYPAAPVPPVQASPPPGQMQQAHAFHYVTKIRDRFTNEPETYRSFLKILHTYQKEQKNIKEVLEQVSQLFADHPDLLMEFTYFLPDAVQEQAKERLERAARESEARKNAKLQAQKQRKSMGGQKVPAMQHPMMRPQDMLMGAQGNPLGMPMMHGMDLTAANLQMGRDGNLTGNKRGRNDKVSMNMMDPAFAQQNYAMQLAAHGIDEAQLARMQPNKKQNIAGGGVMAAALSMPAGSQQRKPRRKNQQGDGFGQLEMNKMGQSNQQMLFTGSAQKGKDIHMSVSAERRFFDQVKDALLAVSRDNWAEFVKCLELFTDDKINKDELLKLVVDLLGEHSDLMNEFKRLLDNRVEYQEHKEDMWFSVPLSEIDFTQCRKCTPSYRALPRDYPRPKCSERNEEEEKLLNDVWVSIPIGSEESYSFKHMRKNQYEEALFKCEDERFEIDMVIDSNMSTIRVLEPLAEEILSLKQIGGKRDPNGPRYSLQLEKRQLSTIHLNAISRIYGDHGEEILEMLRKNPAGTIPVVLKRLKQKDQEWRKARHELNKHWKEVVEKNHYKSFDHRSFYFRQTDKKYLSTKPLVQEIQTVVNNNGVAPGTGVASINTNTSTRARMMLLSNPDDSHNQGVAYSVPSAYESLLAGMSPHMVLSYPHDHHLVHRDIYRIICHAAESTLSNPSDKERLAALWRDLIRTFFNIPPHYLYSQSSDASLASDTKHATAAGEAWPANTKVVTTYGSGTVLSFREDDDIYEVQLAFGKAFLNSSSIFGAEQLSANALYAIGVSSDPKTGKDSIFSGIVDADKRSAQAVQDPCKLFYGTQMCYVFLRLHHTLFMRLSTARQLAREVVLSHQEQSLKNSAHSTFSFTDESSESNSFMVGIDRNKPIYNHFLGQVFSLVEGSIDNARFEDFCRTLLGNKSYTLYTLDKIISQLMKHLQAMANDDNVTKLIGLFVYHHNHCADGKDGVDPQLYQSHVAHILSHTMEEIFRIQLLCPTAGIMSPSSEVSIQHLGIVNVGAPLTAAALNGENASSAPSSLLSTEAMDISNSLKESQSPKAPKAVVSDDEDDDEDTSTKGSLDGDTRKVVFSPRVRN